ncbi:MAG: TIGR00730 family Rossman fold protein [Bdellovibrionaceae bacterium]|nr:TIGR00730 family Rossman fold protein [Pseudobdellovibrionaceae bacterium]|tara:strand:+ start:26995 stop:27531 length:537 start_codon:yes stop_codon:yes gene_type:complete
MMNVCVFCGSREGEKPVFMEAARDLGKYLAENSHTLVYGGANVGLMGAVADSHLKHGGEVIGIMPEVLKHYEVAHEALTELHWVKDMHERKAMMEKKSDAFISLPGGVGTLEEFFEQFTWNQIGVHTKPVGLYNVDSYYELLIQFMQNVERSGFLREGDIQKLSIIESVSELKEKMGI